MTLVANARMYSVAPGAAAAWDALFRDVAARSGVALDVVAHSYPAPLAELWARPDLGCAFMCGWPLAREAAERGTPRPVVAAPVPAAAWAGGKPVYRTEFVVATGGPFQTLDDTFGRRFAYTAEDSHSGWNAPRAHLSRYRGNLFDAVVGPCTTPRRVIEAVLADAADVAPVDGYALDLLRRHDPGLAARLRVVGATETWPVPPLVASPGVPDEAVRRLRAALLAVADPALLQPLCLAGFAEVAPAAYDATLRAERIAQLAGHNAIR